MKKYIKCSAGDKTFYKFIFINTGRRLRTRSGIFKYNWKLKGYICLWQYTYNTITHDTTDKIYPHIDMIRDMPKELYNIWEQEPVSGKTDYGWTARGLEQRFILDHGGNLSAQQISELKHICRYTGN